MLTWSIWTSCPQPRFRARDLQALLTLWTLRNRWRLTAIVYQSVLGVARRVIPPVVCAMTLFALFLGVFWVPLRHSH